MLNPLFLQAVDECVHVSDLMKRAVTIVGDHVRTRDLVPMNRTTNAGFWRMMLARETANGERTFMFYFKRQFSDLTLFFFGFFWLFLVLFGSFLALFWYFLALFWYFLALFWLFLALF